MYWFLAVLIIYILAGLYDERVFAYSALGFIVIIGIASLCLDEFMKFVCECCREKKTTPISTSSRTREMLWYK